MNLRNVLLFLIGVAIIAWIALLRQPESVDAITLKWAGSTHADHTSQAFTNWDANDPPTIPTACAKCHSLDGYLDFVGVDGSAAGVVDSAARIGTVLYCNTCHNPPTHEMTSVVFPSKAEITGLSREAVCMQCHQGRTSTETVNQAIVNLPIDEVSDKLSFINVHYGIAAATQMGGEAQAAYQHEGQSYTGRYPHVVGLTTCVDCHDPHSQRVDAKKCSPCHVTVAKQEDLSGIRTAKTDWDEDGNTTEGVAEEIASLQGILMQMMQAYANQVAGVPIVYGDAFPYFFADKNANGVADADEVNAGNRYQSWTPRLLRAAYNYHFVNEDGGAYVHNPIYVLQFLYDSIQDLSAKVPTPIAGFQRPAK